MSCAVQLTRTNALGSRTQSPLQTARGVRARSNGRLGCYRRSWAAGHTPVRAVATPEAPAASAAASGEEVLSTSTLEDAGLTVTVTRRGGQYVVDLSTQEARPGLVLHWAVNEWSPPTEAAWPPGTRAAGDKAVETPFGDGGRALSIAFPEGSCPSKVVFVLRDGDQWINSAGGDFAAYLKPPGVSDVMEKVLVAESEYEHWSLFNRFILASQLLDAADAAGPSGMAFVMTWLRLSALRQLDWYRRSNYQSKDIAHVQKNMAQRMADKAARSKEPLNRLFARLTLAGLPRGGGNGDDIRMGILNIMRANGIREGHRPGIQDHFLEQWHQKLHTNTTPEDVTICEAYLAFLHSGSMDSFWHVAWERGRITPESLASMDHPITAHPVHLPHLIGPFEHYLWILKTTHSGADLDVMMEMARGHMDGDLAWVISDILAHRMDWWVPGKIVEARHRLKQYWQREGAPRDVLLLDIALDSFFRLRIEQQDKGSLSGDDLVALVTLVLENASIAGESDELTQCFALWQRVRDAEGRWSPEWAQLAMAAADNAALCLEHYCDTIAGLVQPHADRFVARCSSVDPKYVANFGEEVVRSLPVFMLSVLLRFLDPMLRKTAGVGAWQVVSQAVAEGTVVVMDGLEGIQGKHYDEPQVIIADGLTGNEDIPEGVVAVLTGSATDVLSHIAIRARAQGVLLATCFDGEELDGLRGLAGKFVEAGVTETGAVAATVLEGGTTSTKAKAGTAGAPLALAKPETVDKWVLREAEFKEGLVGGKSLNLAALRAKLPAGVHAPASIALPFGTFERVLADPANSAAAAAVARAEAEAVAAPKGAGVPPALETLRATIATQLQPPARFVDEVAAAAAAAGIIPSSTEWQQGSQGWTAAWSAICKVWASKWTDRAWLSRRFQRVPDEALYMAVLLQQIVPAEYAFVLHTADPVTGARGETHGELVRGMGEALVGNYAGRALSFSAGSEGSPRLLALPSKREGLFSPAGVANLIARSDSNGEDLQAFAGAGLYDSVPLAPLEHRPLGWAWEPLVWDGDARRALLERLVEVGRQVEAAFGGAPQDIEGVVVGDKIYIVQSRAQVLDGAT